ncbi:MAG: ABC transporter ATP-binding protein [Coriobacteriia bacterium]|nr:ABC transporter ATP-binding protein [Coriobacteriia bacterium]
MPAIDIQQVSFSYTSAPFLEDFSAKFTRGKVTSIVGPNGCGKSTLVRLISGRERPSEGQVLIDGTPTLSLKNKERACQIAVLAQGNRPPAMTVEALVACGRHPYQRFDKRLGPADQEYVETALELVGIEPLRNHDLRYLSGGERQKAFLAMTLAQDTGTIILDEPTTYLDIGACHETMQLIRMLNETMDKTIIMVIHDIDLALRYSDELVVMQRGACLAGGTVDEVIAAGALEQAFSIRICQATFDEGVSYALFPVR